MTAFIDTNVLISTLNPREPFHAWSLQQLQICKASGPAIICDMVYCEFSVGMKTQADVDAAVSELALERYPRNDTALFRAGKAYKLYQSRRGQKTNVVPDFIIGAIAEVAGVPMITANPKDYVGYFPQLRVISPRDERRP